MRYSGEVGHVMEESTHYYSRPSGGICIDRPLSSVHIRITGAVLMNRNVSKVTSKEMLAHMHIMGFMSLILLGVLAAR